jgi:hypothetical protein
MAAIWFLASPGRSGPEAVASIPAAGSNVGADVDAPVGRLVIASAGLDVPLGVMVVEGGVVDPPDADRAYWLGNHGVAPADGASGTVFVAMHALDDGSGPGNRLADLQTGAVAVAVGDEVVVDGVGYSVTAVGVRAKGDVNADAGLWDPAVPGRLVVVTCVWNAAGWWDNLVVVAMLNAG